MTIDITDLINGPPGENPRDGFEERLKAFISTHEKTHPHLFKPREEKPSETNQEGTEADANKGS